MANLNDSPQWPDVYQLEQSDPVVGGPPNPATGAGMDNIPHLQLAQRTSWLKSAVTALQAATGAASAAVAGIVKLSGATNSAATDTAASSAAVKAANDNAETRALKSTIISAAGLATGGGDLSGSRSITVPAATQAQAEAAATTPATADNTAAMTALRVAQFFAALGLPSVANLIAAVADTTAVRSIATGGTGAATAATALTNLGLPTAALINAAVADTTAVRAIAQGGTGAATAAAALTNMGLTATAAQINGGVFYTGTTAPTNPVEGTRWRDTSTPTAPVDRVYRLGAWVTELVDLGITASATQINPLAAPFDNAFIGAGATGNLASGANNFASGGPWFDSATQNGVTMTKMATGVDTDGLPYVDVRFVGTSTGTVHDQLCQFSAFLLSGVSGQQATASVVARVIAGSAANVSGLTARLSEETAPSTFIGIALGTYITSSTDTISTATRTLTTGNQWRMTLALVFATGVAVNVTYRIKGLQLDRGASRQSYAFKSRSASEARADLGLGTAALVNTGATAGNVPVLDSTARIPVSATPDTITSTVAASGANIVQFSGLNPNAKTFRLGLLGISATDNSSCQIQFGTASGWITTGYVSGAHWLIANSGINGFFSASAFTLWSDNAANAWHGGVQFCALSGTMIAICGGGVTDGAGRVVTPTGALSMVATPVIDRLRIILTGAGSFDAGSFTLTQAWG